MLVNNVNIKSLYKNFLINGQFQFPPVTKCPSRFNRPETQDRYLDEAVHYGGDQSNWPETPLPG